MPDEIESSDIWCCACGDQDYFARLENRVIPWKLQDPKRGIGNCMDCAEVLSEESMVLPKVGTDDKT